MCRGGDWVSRLVDRRGRVKGDCRQSPAHSIASRGRVVSGSGIWKGETIIGSNEFGRIASNYFRLRILRWLKLGELVAGGVAAVMFGTVACSAATAGACLCLCLCLTKPTQNAPKWHPLSPELGPKTALASETTAGPAPAIRVATALIN